MPSANEPRKKKKKLAEAFLIALRGPRRGRVFILAPGTSTLGRDQENAVSLPDAKASRRHASISLDETGATIRDMQSKNGILVNDEQVTEAQLGSGAHIQIGNSLLRFQTDDTDICLEPDVPVEAYETPEPETAVLDRLDDKAKLTQAPTKTDTKAQCAPKESAPSTPAPPPSPKPAEDSGGEPDDPASGLFRNAMAEEAERVDEQYGRSGIEIADGGLQVTCLAGPDDGKSAPIPKQGVVLGSAPDVALTIEATGADPQQVRLDPISGERVRLTNLGALNAVLVDGRPVKTMELELGLQFEICGSQFLIHI